MFIILLHKILYYLFVFCSLYVVKFLTKTFCSDIPRFLFYLKFKCCLFLFEIINQIQQDGYVFIGVCLFVFVCLSSFLGYQGFSFEANLRYRSKLLGLIFQKKISPFQKYGFIFNFWIFDKKCKSQNHSHKEIHGELHLFSGKFKNESFLCAKLMSNRF